MHLFNALLAARATMVRRPLEGLPRHRPEVTHEADGATANGPGSKSSASGIRAAVCRERNCLCARISDRSGPGEDRRPARASTKDVSGHWSACWFSAGTSAIYADGSQAPRHRRVPPSHGVFSDLVGSTALSARMDPEDLREVISAYQKCVAETVKRFGGFVAKYMGDGGLMYLGYPQAYEDDADRAVRAGLELIAVVGVLKTRAPLQIRVGIAMGLVIVGDLVGAGVAQEQGIVGETPNLAARLQGIAEPNTVVIAMSTRRLLGNLFDLEDLGANELKGIEGAVRAYAALRPSTVESRFEALRTAETLLVGRDYG